MLFYLPFLHQTHDLDLTLRKEVSALGLTVLVDARKCSPVPALFKAFNILQVRTP